MRRAAGARPRKEVEELSAHLRRNATDYFGWSSGQRVDVRLRSRRSRPASLLYRFGVAAGAESRELLVKVPLRATGGGGPGRADDGRPRTADPADPQRKFLLEHRALALIHAHFAGLGDPRFDAVRPVDLIEERQAVVMERAAGPNLRNLLIRACSRRRGGPPAAALETAFRNAGSWLAAYHALPGPAETTAPLARPEDFAAFVERLCGFLSDRTNGEDLLRRVGELAGRAAERLPDPLPLGLFHGDFAPRNVVVGPGQTVTVLDTLGRSRAPIYADVGYFLMSLECGRPIGIGAGRARRAEFIGRCERAFLEGYFGPAVPHEAVELFRLQAMLDRWAAVTARRPASGIGVRRVASAARRAALSRLLRRAVERRLRELERAFPAPARPRVAYIMSRFPKLSETFVLYEMLALEAAGAQVEVYPLLRARQPVAHPEAEQWMRRARFHPFVSLGALRAHAGFLRRDPRGYLRLVAAVLRHTWGSANFFFGAVGILPKVGHFAREMEARGVTHIHAHFANHPALAAFVAHRLTGIPYSFTAHGSDLHVCRRMLDVKVAAAAFAVTVSEFNRDVMVESCGEWARERIRIVRCGIDPEVFRPSLRTPDARGPLRIVCVASLEEVKGHRFLIEACAILRRRGIAVRCDLAGDGPLRARLGRQIGALGLDDTVRLLGPRPRPEVVRLLEGADVAVLASHPTGGGKREGIPVALMEAMAAGLPVVATAISGIPELVESGRTGLLVPSGEPLALAEALETLARNPARRERMGRAGREKVLSDHDLRANAKTLLQLIRSAGGVRAEPNPTNGGQWR